MPTISLFGSQTPVLKTHTHTYPRHVCLSLTPSSMQLSSLQCDERFSTTGSTVSLTGNVVLNSSSRVETPDNSAVTIAGDYCLHRGVWGRGVVLNVQGGQQKELLCPKSQECPSGRILHGLSQLKDISGQDLQRAAWFLPFTFLVEHLLQLSLMTEFSSGVSDSQGMNRIIYHRPFSGIWNKVRR